MPACDEGGSMTKYRKNVSVEMRVLVAGHTENILRFRPMSGCGDIEDGVSFAHGDKGTWIVHYKDLEAMYCMARLSRKKR